MEKNEFEKDIFCTPMWSIPGELPEGAYEWALEIQKNSPCSRRSNVGGYQSESNLDWKDFKYIDHIQKQLSFLPNFQFMNWWVNINKKGDYNQYHTHPNSDLSVIWYITDNFNTLQFKNPFEHNRIRLYKNIDIEKANLVYDCTAGHILVFPSDLDHCVLPHTEDTLRISVSFNINFPSRAGYIS